MNNSVYTDAAGLTKIINDLYQPGSLGQINGVPLKIIPVTIDRFRVYLKRYQYATLADLARTRSVEEMYHAASD